MRLQRGGVGFYPGVLQRLRPSRRRQRALLAAHEPRPARPHLPGRQDRPPPDRRPAPGPLRGGQGRDHRRAAAASPATRAPRSAEEAVPGGGKSLWARLFGSDEDDDAALANAARTPATPVAAARPRRGGGGAPTAVATAYAPTPASESGDVRGFFAPRPGSRGRARTADAAAPAGTQVHGSGAAEHGVPRPGGRAASAEAPERSWRLVVTATPAAPPAPDRGRVGRRHAALRLARPPRPRRGPPSRPPGRGRPRPCASATRSGRSSRPCSPRPPARPRRPGRRRSPPPAPRRSRSTVASLLTADTAILQVGFSTAPADDLPQNRFSGPGRQAAARPALTAAGRSRQARLAPPGVAADRVAEGLLGRVPLPTNGRSRVENLVAPTEASWVRGKPSQVPRLLTPCATRAERIGSAERSRFGPVERRRPSAPTRRASTQNLFPNRCYGQVYGGKNGAVAFRPRPAEECVAHPSRTQIDPSGRILATSPCWFDPSGRCAEGRFERMPFSTMAMSTAGSGPFAPQPSASECLTPGAVGGSSEASLSVIGRSFVVCTALAAALAGLIATGVGHIDGVAPAHAAVEASLAMPKPRLKLDPSVAAPAAPPPTIRGWPGAGRIGCPTSS